MLAIPKIENVLTVSKTKISQHPTPTQMPTQMRTAALRASESTPAGWGGVRWAKGAPPGKYLILAFQHMTNY